MPKEIQTEMYQKKLHFILLVLSFLYQKKII